MDGTSTAIAVRQPELFPRDQDAIEIGLLYQKARNSIIEGVHYADEVGRRLLAKKKDVGRGNWLPWLAAHRDELGFGERAAQLMMHGSKWLAANPQLTADLDENTAVDLSRRFWGNLKLPGTQSRGEFERYTPTEIVELCRRVLDEIDLDPASCEVAQRTVRAKTYFTVEMDGLKRGWFGRVMINHPYHKKLGLAVRKQTCRGGARRPRDRRHHDRQQLHRHGLV